MLQNPRSLLLKIRIGLLVLLVAAPTGAWGARDRDMLPYRWVWCMQALNISDQVKQVEDIMRRAKAAGFNGIVLADYKFNKLDMMDDAYFQNLDHLKHTAQELGLDLYPAVCPIGYSAGILLHDPNLAEGLPVRDALFVVKGGQADLAPDPPVMLKNGDFEESQGDKFQEWDSQDYPGGDTFADHNTMHGGKTSLRIENVAQADPKHQHARLAQSVTVAPFRQYHLSVWVKTQDYVNPGDTQVLAVGSDGLPLTFNRWKLPRSQDWTQYDTVFNSLSNKQVTFYLGAWGGKSGRVWWDDAQLEEVGLLNVLRREGCPLTVKGDDGTVYEEGKDYDPVRDDRLGVVPIAGQYETYHKPPVIHLKPGSRIKEGARLRVSFYHALNIHGEQTPSCLSEPKVYDIMQDQVHRVNKLLQPKGFLMSHDELRIVNWCEACQKRHLTPGQLLADNARRCIRMIHKERPDARIFAWNDMFDPYHNAHDNYFLANGTLEGSWEGLSKDVIVVNWNFSNRKEDMPWFARRGNQQILAGYFDADPNSIGIWLDDAKDISGIVGVMYTTWGGNYQDLEAFAKSAWGR